MLGGRAVSHRAMLLPSASACWRTRLIFLSSPMTLILLIFAGRGLVLNAGIVYAAARAAAVTRATIDACSSASKPSTQIPTVPAFSDNTAATIFRPNVSVSNALACGFKEPTCKAVCRSLLIRVEIAGTWSGDLRRISACTLIPCGTLRHRVAGTFSGKTSSK